MHQSGPKATYTAALRAFVVSRRTRRKCVLGHEHALQRSLESPEESYVEYFDAKADGNERQLQDRAW